MRAVEKTITVYVDEQGQEHLIPEKAIAADLTHFFAEHGGYSSMTAEDAAMICIEYRHVLMTILDNASGVLDRD
jgi:hypothetical protein